jgi:predicted O-methyltransferase YrrM
MESVAELYQKYRFEELESSCLLHQAETLHRFVTSVNPRATLETGLAAGATAAVIMNATEGVHYAIDPFQYEWFQNRGLRCIEEMGFSNRLTFFEEFSHFALPSLVRSDLAIDFAFIDGDHCFDGAFLDLALDKIREDFFVKGLAV